MNEFRQQLKDQAATFATREQVDPLVVFQNKIVGFGLAIVLLSSLVAALVSLLLGNTG